MSDSELTRFLTDAGKGRLNRRQVLESGLGLGVSTTLLTSLYLGASDASAAAVGGRERLAPLWQDDDATTLNTLFVSGVTDADPHSNYSTYGGVVALACYDMLIQFKGESTTEYEPMLAESWTASDDLTTFTFKIRANATFHDGTPCTAQSVKDSMVRFRRLEMGPYLVIARFCDDPENMITVPDATTVVFTLPKAEPLFLSAMACSWGPFTVNMARVEENKTDDDPWAHEWFLTNADGTGPYKLTKNDVSEGLSFEYYDGYWGELPANGFTKVNIRIVPENATRRQLLENGEIDLSTNDLTQEDYASLREEGTLQVLTYPTTRVDWWILNYVTLPVEARQGLCFAFPYDEIIAGVYKDTVKRTGPIADNIRGYDPEEFLYTTDLEQAKTLLEAGGFPEGSTITLQTDAESENSKTMAELFQANLAQIGITLEIQAVDLGTQEDTIYGDGDPADKPHIMGNWAWWPDYNDGWNQLAPNFLIDAAGGGGSNGGWYNNATVESKMAEAQVATDEATLNALLKEIVNIIVQQDPAAIFTGQVLYTTVANMAIQGLVFNGLYIEQYFFNKYSRTPA